MYTYAIQQFIYITIMKTWRGINIPGNVKANEYKSKPYNMLAI